MPKRFAEDNPGIPQKNGRGRKLALVTLFADLVGRMVDSDMALAEVVPDCGR